MGTIWRIIGGYIRIIRDVNDSIQLLYEVFAGYPKPKDFPTCECCVSDQQMRALLKRKLHELTIEELSGYVMGVFLTVGSVADFKYFLPRIIELVTTRDWLADLEPEIALERLRLAGWDEWPERERSAVLRVLEEKYSSLLNDEDSDSFEIDGWICALGQCVPDITPYLDQLLGSSHVLDFVERNFKSWQVGEELANPFWRENAPENAARVLAWLNSAEVKRLLSEEYGMVFHD